MKKEFLIGVDIGGTKTSVVLGSSHGEILEKRKFPTGTDHARTLRQISGSIHNLLSNIEMTSVKAIGISCGGPLNSREGLVLSPPNLPGWDNVPVCDILNSKTGIPAFLENDANACALAEWMWGAGKGTENMVFLTFGTGLGAGLILNGSLYEGTSGLAGEVGHIRLSEKGPTGYGKEGSWEGFCSGGGIGRHYKDLFGIDKSAQEICALAEGGDSDALELIRCSAEALGAGISILIDILNPQRVIIGSIYSRNEELFRKIMSEVLNREALPLSAGACQVVPSGLGESLGDKAALGVAINGLKR